MSQFANISGKKAVKAFLKFNYKVNRISGDHAILTKDGGPTLSIPLHKEVAPYLLKKQVEKSGISAKDYLKVVKK